MRVLGIDPGLRITGYGCVDPGGAGSQLGLSLVEAGAIRLVRHQTTPVAARLCELEHDLKEIIERLEPAAVAVESVFSHPRFPQASIAMSHARGVILLTARRAGLEIFEVDPASVKKSLVGSGRATKRQMQAGVQAAFGLPEPPSPADVADALAVACCAVRRAALRQSI